MDRWYKIDNTGKVFHAVTDNSNSSVYRVAIIMKKSVDSHVLQNALDSVIKRFPTLAVKPRKGIFWDFLEQNDKPLYVQEEKQYPCYPINPKNNNDYLVRVLYYKHRISVEIFHSLTDGYGAIEFLKSLIYQYLILQGEKITDTHDVLYPNAAPNKYEIEDGFEKHVQSYKYPQAREQTETVFQIKGTPFDPPGVNVIHGVMQASKVNKFARQLGSSVTGLISAILIHAIYEETLKYGRSNEKIIIALPVNLRQQFPSLTLRNFFSVINVGAYVNDETTLETILEKVTDQLRVKTKKQALQVEIDRYMVYQKKLTARLTPLRLKYVAMRYGFYHFGENSKTTTVSNLGIIKLPESIKPHVERAEVILYPTKNSPINCGICTVNDKLTITFARSILETEIIKSFFTQFVNLTGLDIEVSSNEWGEKL